MVCVCAHAQNSGRGSEEQLRDEAKMNQMMRYRTLGDTGMRLSIISLGGSGYGKVYGDYDETVMQRGFR